MSIVDSLASGPGVAASASSRPSAFATLSSEQFVRIIFTELTNQDPLAPNDTSKLLDQMSSLRSIEADLQLQQKLDALVNANQFATAGSLIGAKVSGLSEQSIRVEGVVESVLRTRDGVVLQLLSGVRVPFKNLDTIGLDLDGFFPLPPPPSPQPVPPVTPTPPPGQTAPVVTDPGVRVGGDIPTGRRTTEPRTEAPPATTPGAF
jgi:flagellar basal-body rod modification protein FlgD